jgi:hypothetical protein
MKPEMISSPLINPDAKNIYARKTSDSETMVSPISNLDRVLTTMAGNLIEKGDIDNDPDGAKRTALLKDVGTVVGKFMKENSNLVSKPKELAKELSDFLLASPSGNNTPGERIAGAIRHKAGKGRIFQPGDDMIKNGSKVIGLGVAGLKDRLEEQFEKYTQQVTLAIAKDNAIAEDGRRLNKLNSSDTEIKEAPGATPFVQNVLKNSSLFNK